MTKEEIYKYLEDRNIWFIHYEHQPVYNMQDLAKLDFKYKDNDAKNLFVRDDKRNNYYLITVKGMKKVDLKTFRKEQNTRNLTFANKEELNDILGLIPGAVSPLGILNDNNLKVKFFIDNELLNNDNIIGIHPVDNTATIFMHTNDLINIIKEHGNEVRKINLN